MASRCAAILAATATCVSVNGGNLAAIAAAHAVRSVPVADRAELRLDRRLACSLAACLLTAVVVRLEPCG